MGNMTGEAEGKLRLASRVILELEAGGFKELEADVFIHVKGYSLARVTHLDIEHEELTGLLPPKGGKFLTIQGVTGGLRISFHPPQRGVKNLMVENSHLNQVLKPGEKTRTWVGGKYGGIYIGFRKAEVRKLENLALRLFNVEPR